MLHKTEALTSSTWRTHTSGIFVKQVVFLTVNHCGLLPLRELHSTCETMMWRNPGGSWACLPPVYNYEWNHSASCCHICRTCPQKQSAEHAPKSSWENRRDLKNTKKKFVSSRIFILSTIQVHLRTNQIFTVTLYQGRTVSHLNASLKRKRKKKPTILDTTQSTANITSISIYVSLIYN